MPNATYSALFLYFLIPTSNNCLCLDTSCHSVIAIDPLYCSIEPIPNTIFMHKIINIGCIWAQFAYQALYDLLSLLPGWMDCSGSVVVGLLFFYLIRLFTTDMLSLVIIFSYFPHFLVNCAYILNLICLFIHEGFWPNTRDQTTSEWDEK